MKKKRKKKMHIYGPFCDPAVENGDQNTKADEQAEE
jgi:hypothetical protein